MDITGGTGSLSRAVKEKNTPLRLYLQQKYPNARPIQAAYKSAASAIAVESAGAPAATVGTAMDLVVRFLLDPNDVPRSARILLPFAEYQDVVDALSRTAGEAVRDGERGRQEFSQAIWALALCVETHRTGGMSSPLILDLFRSGEFDVHTMMSQAPATALHELDALRGLAERALIPRLQHPFHLGPEFDDSKRGDGIDTRLIAAEADLICNGLLLDIKTQLGNKNSAGVRKDTLSADHLYQLLAYALLDYSDTYKITQLGLFSARYGGLHVWSLESITSIMAGREVDFGAARQDIWNMLHA
jgi:hypothetical protein